MLLQVEAARRRRLAVRVALAALIAAGVAGCAKEPPDEAERMSLKDSWASGTTVTHAAPPPIKTVYTPPPKVSPPRVSLPKASAPVKRADPVVKSPVVAAPSAPAAPPPALPKAASPKPPAPKAAPSKPSAPDLALSSPSGAPPKPLSEADLAGDTTRCGVGLDCLAMLRAMIADPQQSWMARTPTLADFTNGTRLFAYRALRTTLDCGKLRFANAELDWAVDTFSGNVDGVDPGHRVRVAALAQAVRAEIQGEIKKRC